MPRRTVRLHGLLDQVCGLEGVAVEQPTLAGVNLGDAVSAKDTEPDADEAYRILDAGLKDVE